MPLGEIPWRRFERRRKSVIPAVEKTGEGDSGYNLQYLIFVEVSSQFNEIDIRYSVLAPGRRLGRTAGQPVRRR